MIGGYVYLNEKLANDIVTNSGTNGSYEFKNCYDIVKEAVSTNKIIIGDIGMSRFYMFSMYVAGASEAEDQIVLVMYGDQAVTCSFVASDKNHYIIGG